MNPSASGWIKKLLNEVSKAQYVKTEPIEYYHRLKQTGFIYGTNIKVVFDIVEPLEFTEEERCKINFLISLFFHFHLNLRKRMCRE